MIGKDLRRFVSKIKIDPLTFCWNWTSQINSNGYGYFHLNKKPRLIHRISYEHWNGSIPPELVIDHLCKNKKCCNPQHLEAVTQKINVSRDPPSYPNREKTRCKHGHEYTPENTYVNKYGTRDCKICRAIRVKKHLRKKETNCFNC